MVTINGLTNNNASVAQRYKEGYTQWRNFRKEVKENYYIIPKELEEYLPYINSRALSLYLYYCLNSRNETGESWHSINTIAEKMNVSSRSVNTWNNDLEKAGLIVRLNDRHNSKTTFLLPLSNYYILENEFTIQEIMDRSTPEIDGELIAIYHLFQYKKEKSKYSPYNVACLVFRRNYNIGGKNIEVFKYILSEEKVLQDFSLKSKYSSFNTDAYTFEDSSLCNIYSAYKMDKTQVQGYQFAIESKNDLTDPESKDVLDILNMVTSNVEKVGNMDVIK